MMIQDYTEKQIENAKRSYNAMLVIRTVESFEPQFIGWASAQQRCDFHNKIVSGILSGNKELEREWKLFFLQEEVKKDSKLSESKEKRSYNRAASSDILTPIKSAKKLVEFGNWLNTKGNQFRKEHFTKKYTQESVNSFLQTI